MAPDTAARTRLGKTTEAGLGGQDTASKGMAGARMIQMAQGCYGMPLRKEQHSNRDREQSMLREEAHHLNGPSFHGMKIERSSGGGSSKSWKSVWISQTQEHRAWGQQTLTGPCELDWCRCTGE